MNTLEEQSEMGYNTLSEYDWENDEVSDWGRTTRYTGNKFDLILMILIGQNHVPQQNEIHICRR